MRNESILMLNRLSITLPVTAKKRAIAHASVTAFFAILFFSLFVILLVMETKVTAPLIGSTITKIDVNAKMKNSRLSTIIFFLYSRLRKRFLAGALNNIITEQE